LNSATTIVASRLIVVHDAVSGLPAPRGWFSRTGAAARC
jgi:hypothetical protein